MAPIDDDVRTRFHAHANDLQAHALQLGLLEQRMKTVEGAVIEKVDRDLMTEMFERVRADLALVRNAVFGVIALIVAAVITALVGGVLR